MVDGAGICLRAERSAGTARFALVLADVRRRLCMGSLSLRSWGSLQTQQKLAQHQPVGPWSRVLITDYEVCESDCEYTLRPKLCHNGSAGEQGTPGSSSRSSPPSKHLGGGDELWRHVRHSWRAADMQLLFQAPSDQAAVAAMAARCSLGDRLLAPGTT